MNKKRLAVSCPSCKVYDFPRYYIGTSTSENKKSHVKRSFPCICSKGNANGKKDVDSLGGMRDTNECVNLDDRIKNLKTELSSLTNEQVTYEAQINDTNLNEKKIIRHSVIKHVHKSYEESVSCSGDQVDVNPNHITQKPNTSSNENDFTNWLDSTIDSLIGKPCSNDCEDSPISTEKIEEGNRNFDKLDDENDCIIETDYSAHDIDNLQIAQELLYESFVVQNYPCYVPPGDDDVIALPMSLAKRKHERRLERRNRLAKKTKTSDTKQKSVPKQEENDNKKAVIQYSSDNDVEVINIDDDSNNSYSENKKVNYTEDKDKVIVIDDNETVPERRTTRKESPRLKRAIKKESLGLKKEVWECPICFEHNTGQEVVTTMCGHIFCKKCLEDYFITYKENCPTCRTVLCDKPLITLFNF